MKEKKISIIISVYNEENAIDKFFEEFDKIKNQFKWDYEIIFVNDGSNDNSLKMLYEYAARDEKAKIISFSRNFGHEAAMIAGIMHQVMELFVWMLIYNILWNAFMKLLLNLKWDMKLSAWFVWKINQQG